MVLEQAAKLSDDPVVRFAALTHDLGKGTTPPSEWPRHVAHEQRGVALVEATVRSAADPERLSRARGARLALSPATRIASTELRDGTLLDLLERLDAFRRPARFEQFVLACEADARGRKGLENRDYPQADHLASSARMRQRT